MRPITFAILGDSAATGVGDYDSSGRTRGWCHYLVEAFERPLNIVNVARAGAQSKEVFLEQLPKVIAYSPDIAAVVVGGNDALRNGFSPQSLYENLRSTIAEMKFCGAEVLMIQLHDPTRIVPLPRLLQRVLRRRIEAVNAVYERVAQEFEVVFLPTRELHDIYDLKLWHFDRMHPSTFGHRKIAQQFREMLSARGWKIGALEDSEVHEYDARARRLWMIRNATPWFLKRSFDLLPAALVLMVYEALRIIIKGEWKGR